MNGMRFLTTAVLLAGLVVAAHVLPLAPAQETYRMVTNYPNPFDSRAEFTTIFYTLPAEAEVRVSIYDLFGNLVREYPAERENPGTKKIVWDGTNGTGDKVAKGGYLCVVKIGGDELRLTATRKIGVVH